MLAFPIHVLDNIYRNARRGEVAGGDGHRVVERQPPKNPKVKEV